MLDLRPYQREALDKVAAAEARGLQRVIVAAATGLGKTVKIAHLLRERPGRGLVLAHRDELVRQAADKVGMVTGQRCGIVKADEDQVGADIVIASVQTLARPARLERLLASTRAQTLFDMQHGDRLFRTVVVDEVHHYVAGDDGNTFGRVLEGLGCMSEDGPLTVGFTATPERDGGAQLGGTWQEIVFEMGILDGIRQGFLCDLRGIQVKLRADYSRLHVRAGEFRDEESAELLMEADAPRHAAQAWLEHAAGLKTLAFTPTVAVAHAFAAAFRERGIAAEAVDGAMDIEQRRAILRRFSTGETLVVPNCAVLTEGYDEPSVGCIIVARPTRSRATYIQCVGRGTRLYPGKADCLVLDLVGTASRHDLATMATLFDVDPEDELLKERGVAAAIAGKAKRGKAEDGAAVAAKLDEKAGELVATDFSLFKQRDFAWTPGKHGRFVLSLGQDGHVVLEPGAEPGTWDVVQSKRIKDGTVWRRGQQVPHYSDQRRKLYAGLDLGYAMGAGEDYVRKQGKGVLNARDAAWRQQPATDKQIETLKRRGKWRDGMTKGQASEAIDAMFAR